MIAVATSAPGKLLVAGEYAVLDGAPAICMAVNRRARVTIQAGNGGAHQVAAPGFLPGAREFSSIEEVADAVPLLAAVWHRYVPKQSPALTLEIDTSEFQRGTEKLGIGSSAAATVALCSAFAALFETSDDVKQAALAAHRDLQNGLGSGADVACSTAGGLVEYRMQGTRTRNLQWPQELHYALLWSGRPASTAKQLDKLARESASGQQLVSAELLKKAAQTVADAWHGNASGNVLDALRTYAQALRQYDADNALGIYTFGHDDLARHAESTEVVYKPCGAGGGDFGIAIADDRAALQIFVTAARSMKFEAIDLAIEPTGVSVESDRQ